MNEPKNIRGEIIDILLKWGMPTRQIVINELVSLIQTKYISKVEVIELIEKEEENLKDINIENVPDIMENPRKCLLWHNGMGKKQILDQLKQTIEKKESNWICGKCEMETGKYPEGEPIPEHSRHCKFRR